MPPTELGQVKGKSQELLPGLPGWELWGQGLKVFFPIIRSLLCFIFTVFLSVLLDFLFCFCFLSPTFKVFFFFPPVSLLTHEILLFSLWPFCPKIQHSGSESLVLQKWAFLKINFLSVFFLSFCFHPLGSSEEWAAAHPAMPCLPGRKHCLTAGMPRTLAEEMHLYSAFLISHPYFILWAPFLERQLFLMFL